MINEQTWKRYKQICYMCIKNVKQYYDFCAPANVCSFKGNIIIQKRANNKKDSLDVRHNGGISGHISA